ncbi:unnamed protein product [Moneuplotes crassus]|uniref:Protein YIF1 n=1 Tax=Euplotes crassus TaxID=5936 RepID=A0AAD1XPN5_EUPCR|nr:unnamed protein product [Moneuplotes crassus]
MRLPDPSNNGGGLGAKRIPANITSDPFSDPKIATGARGNNQNNFNPFNEFASNEVVQNMAGNLIKDQVSKQAENYRGIFTFDLIRPYFNVDNTYIYSKFKLIFLPFLEKGDWKSEGEEKYMSSNMEYEDFKTDNSKIDPFGVDLYLPLMALVTFTQVVGFYHGALDMFDPELLEYLIGKCLFVWLSETIMIKLFLMCQNVPYAPFMEILCICGYKFVTLSVCSIMMIIGGRWLYYSSLLILGSSLSIFMIKTLKRYTHFSGGNYIGQSNISKATILYILGGIQIPLLLILNM